MRLWKVNCMENRFPGMWQRWFRNQCVAVGWHSGWGHHLVGKTKGGQRGWIRARKVLQEIEIGDCVVVALRNNRIGRLGIVTGKAVADSEWDPLVPKGPGLPDGEMGRRIYARWDLTVGPNDQDMIIALPTKSQFTAGELRPTISQIRSQSFEKLKRAMKDPENWVGLLSHFDYERSLSEFLAAYPHRLGDGLLPHPNERIRERIFKYRSRLDVLLMDRDGLPVIVECKQGSPTVANVKQLRHYLWRLAKETGQKARGILVHGGARKLRRDVLNAAKSKPRIEIVQYKLDVELTPSS
jgi:hypothetical protein